MATSERWYETVLRYLPLGIRLIRALRRRRGAAALREWELEQRRRRDARIRRRR